MLNTMLDVLFLRLRIKGLRKAIAISGKLPVRAWTALALVFFLLLCTSVALLPNHRNTASRGVVLLVERSGSFASQTWEIDPPYLETGCDDCLADFDGFVAEFQATPIITEINAAAFPKGAEFNVSINGSNFVLGETLTITVVDSTSISSSPFVLSWTTANMGTPTVSSGYSLIITDLGDTTEPQVAQNVYYVQAAPEPQKSESNLPLWIATIMNALGTISTSFFAWFAYKHQEKLYRLQELETQLKLKEMELKVLQLQLELDRARSQPLVLLG